MATLYITGYQEVSGFDMTGSGGVPVPQEPANWADTVAVGTETDSLAIPRRVRFLRLHSDTDCHIKVGSGNPVATTNDQPLTAYSEYWRGKAAVDNLKISVIAAA